MRVHVLGSDAPHIFEAVPVEERGRKRQAAAEGFADTQDVGDLLSWPHLAYTTEPRVDRVHEQQRFRLVAAAPQRLEEAVRRHPRACPPLHRLDDHAADILWQRPGI